jgi:hypothetical protein
VDEGEVGPSLGVGEIGGWGAEGFEADEIV